MALTVRDIVRLADNGALSPVLVRNWQATRGYDPVVDARGILKHYYFRRRLTILARISFIALCVWWFFWTKNLSPVHINFLWIIFSGCQMILACFLIDTLLFNSPNSFLDPRDRRDFGRPFEYVLENFAKWTRNSLEELSDLSEERLRDLARDAMFEVTQKILDVEYEFKDVPQDHEGQFRSRKSDLTRQVELRYDALARLGLVQGGYGPYYRLAKKRT